MQSGTHWARRLDALVAGRPSGGYGVCGEHLSRDGTHKLGSLYDTFAPAEARRIAQRLELHYTPVHGSWLNMAELELSVFSKQCLHRRIGSAATLQREVTALVQERNQAVAVIDWRFSTQDARTKLPHIYPSYSG